VEIRSSRNDHLETPEKRVDIPELRSSRLWISGSCHVGNTCRGNNVATWYPAETRLERLTDRSPEDWYDKIGNTVDCLMEGTSGMQLCNLERG
jgi:hypothetical protein